MYTYRIRIAKKITLRNNVQKLAIIIILLW